MKDTHNIILIIVSSKWSSFFFQELFIMSFFLVRGASSFLFRSSKFSWLSSHEAPSKSSQGSPCSFNFSFFLSFFYYQGSTLRLDMVIHQGFLSFFNCSSRFLSKLWSAKLYSKINMVPNTCFVLMRSSILLLAFRSAIRSTLSFEVVLYHSWQFSFMFHDSYIVKNEVF